MFQSYNMEDCYNTDDECVKLIQRYPDSKVLYLSRIRLNELLPSGNKEIERILKDIVKNVDKRFDATDFYHYYMAMTQWEIIEEKDNHRNLIFFELKNKKYYQMINPDAYIDELNKAISVR